MLTNAVGRFSVWCIATDEANWVRFGIRDTPGPPPFSSMNSTLNL